MIQYFIDMPIEKQTWTVLAIGWVMLAASAAIREKTPPGECRNWARALGVFGVMVVSLQTIHTTMIAEELNTELMVRRGSRDGQQAEAMATQIADPVRVVAVASEYETTTTEGVKVSVIKYSDGRVRPMLTTLGRSGFDGISNGSASDRIGRTGTGLGGSNRFGDSVRSREF